MGYRLDFATDGAHWPNRDHSRFVEAAGLRWHVQRMGRGPVALLLHGTGASTHSFRGLLPALAADFDVIAPDLPGHGFTSPFPPGRATMEAMGAGVAELLAAERAAPVLAVGHSAGAAILIRMALDGQLSPDLIVSLNGALMPLGGNLTRVLFSPMAKCLALNPWAPSLMSRQLRKPEALERLLRNTGSRLDAEGTALYGQLARSAGHVAGALDMMASWDLPGFARDLPALRVPLLQLIGSQDRTIPPDDAHRVKALVPHAEIVMQRGLGHLAHEEAPEATAALIVAGHRALRRENAA